MPRPFAVGPQFMNPTCCWCLTPTDIGWIRFLNSLPSVLSATPSIRLPRKATRHSPAVYSIDSDETHWNSGRDADEFSGTNLGYRIRPKEGYVPVPPTDSLSDLRSEISLTLAKCGINVECHHHEVATAGQCEIDFRYSTLLG